jgi:hypothetical protein
MYRVHASHAAHLCDLMSNRHDETKKKNSGRS